MGGHSLLPLAKGLGEPEGEEDEHIDDLVVDDLGGKGTIRGDSVPREVFALQDGRSCGVEKSPPLLLLCQHVVDLVNRKGGDVGHALFRSGEESEDVLLDVDDSLRELDGVGTNASQWSGNAHRDSTLRRPIQDHVLGEPDGLCHLVGIELEEGRVDEARNRGPPLRVHVEAAGDQVENKPKLVLAIQDTCFGEGLQNPKPRLLA